MVYKRNLGKDLEELERLEMPSRNNKGKRFKWEVKTVRPEEIHEDPLDYFDTFEVEKYSHSTGMQRAQERVAQRILELIELPKTAKILDMGCGVGYTTQFYVHRGYEVVGLDINTNMLEYAKQKGLNVVRADMREISHIFDSGSFQGIVSASALQWLTRAEDLRQVANGINHVLSKEGRGAIQFYPKSDLDLSMAHKEFLRAGLKTEVIVDVTQNQKKRTSYLLFSKS